MIAEMKDAGDFEGAERLERAQYTAEQNNNDAAVRGAANQEAATKRSAEVAERGESDRAALDNLTSDRIEAEMAGGNVRRLSVGRRRDFGTWERLLSEVERKSVRNAGTSQFSQQETSGSLNI